MEKKILFFLDSIIFLWKDLIQVFLELKIHVCLPECNSARLNK